MDIIGVQGAVEVLDVGKATQPERQRENRNGSGQESGENARI